MKKIFFILLLFSHQAFALAVSEPIKTDVKTTHDLITNRSLLFVDILSLAESFLLKVALPLVIIGTFLYVAWELLTAEGNEEKMKKAWKTLTFSTIGVIVITIAYAIVAMASRLSL